MRKALSVLLILCVCFLGGLYSFSQEIEKNYCAFCDPAVLQAQVFYEDDLVYALCTYRPIFPGHSLVIPKRHVERFEMLTDAEMLRIDQVLKKVNTAVREVFHTSAYLLLQKNGREAGQTVPHVHFHYIPRKAGEDSALAFVLRMFWVNALPPKKMAELQETVAKLKQAM
jgi:histidine triad (HIT) family protein